MQAGEGGLCFAKRRRRDPVADALAADEAKARRTVKPSLAALLISSNRRSASTPGEKRTVTLRANPAQVRPGTPVEIESDLAWRAAG
jgi:hypothetical protein